MSSVLDRADRGAYATDMWQGTHAIGGLSLFDAIVGDRTASGKRACSIASLIEQQFICGDRFDGEMLGSEQNLAEHYGVCRVVIREAARVLQARGIARARRGRNGGLVLHRPEIGYIVERASRYALYYCADVSQAVDAACTVARTVADVSRAAATAAVFPPGLHFVVDFLWRLVELVERSLDPPADPPRPSSGPAQPAGGRVPTRAPQIANRLMFDARSELAGNGRIGSEFDLSDRYQVDRSVLRQAIRILENEGFAASIAGRGNGLMLGGPQLAPACRLIHCLFASYGVSAEAALLVFEHLGARMAALAAERVDQANVARMRVALQRLEQAGEEECVAAIRDVEDSQFDILANPILNLMLIAVKSFPAWQIADGSALLRNKDVYARCTLNVMEAIASGSPARAADAQRLKFVSLCDAVAHDAEAGGGDLRDPVARRRGSLN